MAFIDWNDSLSVKVGEIDEQHKKLIGMINTLHEAMSERRGHEVLRDILNGMAEYADYHFKTEERYFEIFKYERTEEHKQQHTAFIEKTAEFIKKFADSRMGVTIEIMNFLNNWLINHIKGSDKLYSQCFNEHGLH